MIVSITGGTGFIGSELVKRHLEMNDTVRVLSRNDEKYPTKFGTDNIQYMIGDITDNKTDFSEFLKDTDVLYHCAGEFYNQNKMVSINIAGTNNISKAAAGNIKHMVYISSVSVYGNVRNENIDEGSKPNPTNLYQSSKFEAENIVINLLKRTNTTYTILRPSKVFGINSPDLSMDKLIRHIKKGNFIYIGSRKNKLNYIYIDDIVQLLYLCSTNENARDKIFNISDTISTEDLVNHIKKIENKKKYTFTVPRILSLLIAEFFYFYDKFPIKYSQIYGLTNNVTYSANKIKDDIGYESKGIICGVNKLYGIDCN